MKQYVNCGVLFMDDFKNALFINYGGLGDEILFLPAIED